MGQIWVGRKRMESKMTPLSHLRRDKRYKIVVEENGKVNGLEKYSMIAKQH